MTSFSFPALTVACAMKYNNSYYLHVFFFCLQALKSKSQLHSFSFEDEVSNFADERKLAANSLADLCIEHYNDMASNTSSTFYLLSKKLEHYLSCAFPSSFVPLYSMVAFSRTPYNKAVSIAKSQDAFVRHILYATTFATSCAVVGTACWLRLKAKM